MGSYGPALWVLWTTKPEEQDEDAEWCEACDKKLTRYNLEKDNKESGPGIGRRTGYCRECVKAVKLEELQIEGIGD